MGSSARADAKSDGVDPSAGASKDAVDHAGWTPLHRAANNGRLPVCRALLAVGANPAFRDEKGKKPIDVLCGARGADRASKQVIHALLSAADAGD